jgi:ABC-type sulfate/molybdate transport systems ATPase subunit
MNNISQRPDTVASLECDAPKAASTPAIELSGLCTRLRGEILHDHLDLVIYPDEIVGLVGASGSGKSILLRTLLGLAPLEAGEIRIFGTDIATASEETKRVLSANWGVVFQEGALFSSLTVRENVAVTASTRSARLHFFQSATRSRIGTPCCMVLLATAFPEGRAKATAGRYTPWHRRRNVTGITHIRIF